MLPSEGRVVCEEIVGNSDTPGTQVLDGAVEVDGVPVEIAAAMRLKPDARKL